MQLYEKPLEQRVIFAIKAELKQQVINENN